MNKNKSVSIIIPVLNEERFISSLLESIALQDYDHQLLEIIIIDGDSDDKTIENLNKAIESIDIKVKVLINKKRITPISLNMGIKESSGDLIMRLDAHCEYPHNYITTLVEKLISQGVDNVGCSLLNTAPDTSLKSIAIANACGNKVAVGNSNFRIGGVGDRLVDTVPFGLFRKEIFEKIGLFNEALVRSQDYELNMRIIASGGKILLTNDIVIKYFTRDNLKALSKMFYQYGFGKTSISIMRKKIPTVRQLIPFLFYAFLTTILLLTMVNKIFIFAFFSIVLAYVLMIFCCTKSSNLRIKLYETLSILVIHFSYFLGTSNSLLHFYNVIGHMQKFQNTRN